LERAHYVGAVVFEPSPVAGLVIRIYTEKEWYILPMWRSTKETVNRALRQAGGSDRSRVERSLERLARAKFADRGDAWR
jgi:hypothetical protein